MFVIARDVVNEERERRQKNSRKKEEHPAEEEKPKPVAREVVNIGASAEPEEVAPEAVADNSSVTFSKATQTLEEKYLELSSEYRGYYDEIVKCAMAVEGSRRFKNENYEEYKVGKNRIVRLRIKRGIVICELVIPNLTFKTYVADKKIAMRQAPATIKLVDEDSLAAVKDSISIAVKAIEEEKAYKKEQAKIRRREKRESARANAGETAE